MAVSQLRPTKEHKALCCSFSSSAGSKWCQTQVMTRTQIPSRLQSRPAGLSTHTEPTGPITTAGTSPLCVFPSINKASKAGQEQQLHRKAAQYRPALHPPRSGSLENSTRRTWRWEGTRSKPQAATKTAPKGRTCAAEAEHKALGTVTSALVRQEGTLPSAEFSSASRNRVHTPE